MKCKYCKLEMMKVIYMGLPMKLCMKENCNAVYGFWSFILFFHFNGCFLKYEGHYLKGLYHYLRGDF
jgi:hypothetical protein